MDRIASLLADRPHLFSAAQVKVSRDDTPRMAALIAAVDEEGPDGTAGRRLQAIRDREEAIAHFLVAGDVDRAYHLASSRHKCAVDDGQC